MFAKYSKTLKNYPKKGEILTIELLDQLRVSKTMDLCHLCKLKVRMLGTPYKSKNIFHDCI